MKIEQIKFYKVRLEGVFFEATWLENQDIGLYATFYIKSESADCVTRHLWPIIREWLADCSIQAKEKSMYRTHFVVDAMNEISREAYAVGSGKKPGFTSFPLTSMQRLALAFRFWGLRIINSNNLMDVSSDK